MTKAKTAEVPFALTAKRTDLFTPLMLKDTQREAAFKIRIPTPHERDVLNTRLYEMGLQPITDQTFRAHQVNSIFEIDWLGDGDVDGDANQAKAEEIAETLDSYWIRNEQDQRALDLWNEQETERLRDEFQGIVKEPTPMPKRLLKIREHSKMQLLLDDISIRAPRMRSIIAKRMNWGVENTLLLGRLQILDVIPKSDDWPAGLEGDWPEELVVERDKDGLLTLDYTDRLREHIGEAAWREVIDRCDSHFRVSETERKNFVSPPGTQSEKTGSPAMNGAGESSDGNSKE